MSKTLSTLEFCKLACSKDESRYNLNQVYRDTESFVATDGHRLHYVNGQLKLDKGFFPDGCDGEFPDYKQVFPSSDAIGECELSQSDYENMKALLSTVKFSDKKGCSVLLHLTKEGSSIKFLNSPFSLELKLDCVYTGEEFKAVINLQYMVEAMTKPSKFLSIAGKLTVYGGLKPIIIERMLESGMGKALIMPMIAPK